MRCGTGKYQHIAVVFALNDLFQAQRANAVAADWLELDEGYRVVPCHAGLYVIPALLAEAETATDAHRISDIHMRLADIDAHNSWAYGRALGVPPERLLAGLRQNGRDNARTPMQWDASEHGGFTTGTPWLPLNPNTSEVNVEAQIDDADSVLAHYRRLIELRHSSDIVVFGDYRLLARDHEYLYAFERTLGDERWIVVANFSDEELDVAAALGGAGRGLAARPRFVGDRWGRPRDPRDRPRPCRQ